MASQAIEFVSFAACTPNQLLVKDLAPALYARSRSCITFCLTDSGEFAASTVPSTSGQPTKSGNDYGKNIPGRYVGGFGVSLSSKDPQGYPATTEWRIGSGLILHPSGVGQPVVVSSPGDWSIWSGWRAQASDYTNPKLAPLVSEQNGYVYWDDAARHAIGIQFFSGDGGILVAGLQTPPSGTRAIEFGWSIQGLAVGGMALRVAADTEGAGNVEFFGGLAYTLLVDVSSSQLRIPVLAEAPTGLPFPSPVGLYVDRVQQRLYVAAPMVFGPGQAAWSGWHYWDLQNLP